MLLRIDPEKGTRHHSRVVSLDMSTATQVYPGKSLDTLTPSHCHSVTILSMKTL